MIKNTFLLLFTLLPFYSVYSQGYKYNGQVVGLNDSTCMLAYYYGDKQYAKDTAEIDANGKFVFEGDEALDHGMYMVVLPDGNYFEMVITEDKFSFSTSLNNLIGDMKFTNSSENEKFYRYMQFISEKQTALKALQDKKESATETEKKKIDAQIESMSATVMNFQENFTSENPDILFSKILLASKEIDIPEPPINSYGSIDSTFQFNYYKSHFFDNLDFSDDRLLRTPVFHSKINTYLENLTAKMPDSLIVSCDYLISKSKANPKVFRYLVSYLTSKYERSKIMGLEKVFVHLVKKHYATNEVDWLDEAQMFKIVDRAETIEPLMLGSKAPNLVLRDSSDVIHNMYNLSTDLTMIIFYDPDCGHCKKEIPVIKQNYDEWLKDGISISVMAVSVELDREKWVDFIKTYDIGDWINTAEFKTFVDGEYNRENDPYVTPFPYIKQLYDINGTPKVYLLDKDKNIIVNAIKGNIGVEQLSELIINESKK
jgi:thiol-disulfide isomerase/thioredoxin